MSIRVAKAASLGVILLGVAGCAVLNPLDEARQEAKNAPPVRPADPVEPGRVNVARAESLASAGDQNAALLELERAIAVNPKLTVAYLKAGDIYGERGDWNTAESRYGEAASVEPQNFDAQYKHGLSLQMLSRFAESVRAYLRALAIRPNDFEANLNLATAYLQLEEPRQAQVYAVRAVRLNSRSGAARANLGAVYAALGEHEAAVNEYQQASGLMELSSQLLLNWADSLSRTGRHAEAVNTLGEVIRIEPSATAYERLGAARFRMRAYAEAESAFTRALELDGNHYPALNGLAVCLLNRFVWSKEVDTEARLEAVRLLRRSMQIESRQPQIAELLRRYG